MKLYMGGHGAPRAKCKRSNFRERRIRNVFRGSVGITRRSRPVGYRRTFTVLSFVKNFYGLVTCKIIKNVYHANSYIHIHMNVTEFRVQVY